MRILLLLAFMCKVVTSVHDANNQNFYSFNYVIDAGNVLSQRTEEGRNNIVTGYYSFLQPDGKIRIVRYKSDMENGFRAYVKYRGVSDGIKGHLRFPRDFKHPIIFAEPVSTIPNYLLDASSHQKKQHGL